MEAGPVAEIGDLLSKHAVEHKVVIPLAIESGSRAWGFPSPDSDYDCRFVFIRPMAESYTLFPRRDVIEHPISALIDVSGWELSKALRLLVRGNAVIVEWLTSPFAYQVDDTFRSQFLDLARQVGDRNLFGRHYFHLADGQGNRILAKNDDVALKKLLYVLRPLMALRWLTQHPDQSVAPMNFNQMCAETEMPSEARKAISILVEQKRVTREIGRGPVPAEIRNFIEQEFEASSHWRDAPALRDAATSETRVDAFWRHWVERQQ